MSCALATSIMSTEYAPQDRPHRQLCSSLSTSGEEMCDEHHPTKLNSSPSATPPLTSSHKAKLSQSVPMAVPFRPNHHSFSIEALVGNTKSIDSDKVSLETDSWSSNNLIDLKRIQAYYQQFYSQSLPLKQLNYFYPHLSDLTDNGIKQGMHEQQLLAYYNLYLQNSSFYQDRYLDSLKAVTTDRSISESNLNGIGHETKIPQFEKAKSCDNDLNESNQRKLSESEGKDSSPATKNDRYLHTPADSFFTNACGSSDQVQGISSSSGVSGNQSFPSSLDKPVDLGAAQAQAGLPSTFPQHLFSSQSQVTPALNSAGFYSPFCDYDLLAGSKSSLLLTSSSPNGATTPKLLHSPSADSNDPAPPSNAAAAAAYHLSNMFRKPKRIRTAFSPGQLLRLEEIFEKNRYVVGCERKQLARDLNLSETQIKVWFQNRRTKHKREKHVTQGSHSLHQSSGYGLNDKKSSRQLVSSSSSSSTSLPSASSMSSSTYLTGASFGTSQPYGGHFKSQNNVHQTLLAK